LCKEAAPNWRRRTFDRSALNGNSAEHLPTVRSEKNNRWSQRAATDWQAIQSKFSAVLWSATRKLKRKRF